MNIKTRDFGEIQVEEKDIIKFAEPIFGFENYTRFAMLFDDEIGTGFAWLQSVETPDICFILANPDLLNKEYNPHISRQTLNSVGGSITDKWLVAVIAENMDDSTVNLKSPVVINMDKTLAAQTLAENDYPVRYGLFSGKEFD